MKVKLSHHAYKRMTQNRQRKIELSEVYDVARTIKTKIKSPGLPLRSISKKGRLFEVVVVDDKDFRLVKTVMGLGK